MRTFNVIGMSCAACSARVEKAINSLENIDECHVNLLTNSMTVSGNATDSEIIDAVRKAGYDANVSKDKSLFGKKDKNSSKKIKGLVASIVLLFALMYLSMGYTMWGFPLPSFLDGKYVIIAASQAILTLIIMIINRRFFINGIKGFINKSPNMDTLVSMGAGAAFIYSAYMLAMMIYEGKIGDFGAVHHYMHELYFESAAMILTLISVGKMLEERSKGKTTNAINSLIELAPKYVTVLCDGKEKSIPASEIKSGDIYIVRPGEIIAVDGEIIDGNTSVDESALTGESVPANKTVGDEVFTGTHNVNGFVKCRATNVGEKSVLSRIIRMVNDASAGKAPIARIADRVSAYFVPIVIIIAVITTIVWLIADYSFGFALARGISVLVISCPCALGLATPVAIMVGNGVAAKNGILFKTATALEQTGKCKNVLLDKTGTITMGRPTVTDIVPFGEIGDDQLLSIAYSLEKPSLHPLAVAICNAAVEKGVSELKITAFKEIPGKGISAKIENDGYFAGNLKSVTEHIEIDSSVIEQIKTFTCDGKTPVVFVKNNVLIGFIALRDSVKQDSVYAVDMLKKMGINVGMLTGDNSSTAEAIARLSHIENVISGVLPDKKAQAVEEEKQGGFTVMVGDGINDAPALTAADIGMAIGTGTDIAIDSADVVLTKDSLIDVVNAIRISRATLKNIKQNLFWAFIYNIIGIPIAAGVFILPFGIELNPMFAAAAMSFSSFFVVTNALRLNFFKVQTFKEEGVKTMEKIMIIDGMMCEHCSARVKSTLEALDAVSEVTIDLKAKTATICLKSDIADDALAKGVEEQGYKVVEVK